MDAASAGSPDDSALSRRIFDSTLDAVVVIDDRGIVRDWNSRAEALFGWPAADALGRPMAELIIPPRFREAHHRGMSRFLASGEGPILGRRMEMRALRRDGSEFPVELSISAARRDGAWTFIGFLRDQTLEKQALGKLQVQSALFRMLAESPSPEAMEAALLESICALEPWLFGACWRPDGDRIRCGALRERSGLSFPEVRARTLDLVLRPGEGLPGRAWEARVPVWMAHREKEPGLRPRLEAARREGLMAAFALPVVVRGETFRVFEFFSRDPREPDPDLIAFAASLGGQLGLYLDRKAAEEEVARYQKRYQALMEASSDVVAIVLPDGRVEYVSESIAKVMGYTDREYTGRIAFDDIHPEDVGRARETFARVLSRPGAAAGLEMRVRHKDGSWRWLEGMATNMLHEPAIGGLLANLREITERRRAQQERETLLGRLREERERLSAILDFTPIPIVLLDPGSGRVDFANKAAHRLAGGTFPTGLAYAEFPEGFHAVDKGGRRLGPEEAPSTRAARGENLADMEVTWNVGGKPRDLLVNSATLSGLDGKPETVVIAFQDVSHLKQVEAQLRQSQKMEAIGQLAGGIAHDFNNLLTAINGYSSMALERLAPEDPLHGFMSEVLRSGERAAGLTRQLLAYSRKQVLEARVWDLNVIVGDMQAMLRRLIGENIALSTALSPVPAKAKVDRGQVEQILLNLLLNSRDAMPDGGRVILETRRIELDAEYCAVHPEAQPGPHAVLSVSDTGVGMTTEVKSRAFEPFFTTKEVGKGTGLGLSSVYGIVKQSGGFVSLYSEPGRGTSMRIYFPEADTEARPESAAAAAPSFRGSETVLLVEDEEAVRRFAAQALEVQGYAVSKAANGREALEILERMRGEVSLVVTDVVMPDMGGQVLADRLRERFPGLPVLFISGYTESAVIHRGLRDRAGSFLQKPFGPTDLARAVREALDGKAAGQRTMERKESE